MLITIHHTISDPDEFWRLAADGIAHTPRGLTLHGIRRDPVTGLCSCDWEASGLPPLRDWMEGAVGHVSANRYVEPVVSALRGKAPFVAGEIEWIRDSPPQLAEVPTFDSSRGAAELVHEIVTELIERLALGVVLADARGRPRVINSAAQTLFSLRDGITLTHDGIVAATHAETLKLRQAMSAAAATTVRKRSEPGQALTISRPSAKRPFSVLVIPLRAGNRLGPDDSLAALAVFISDPESMVSANALLLQRLFDLTPTEAQFASLLADGRSVEQVAEALAISLNTARWHLKHIFQKAGIDSQRELVKVILSSPAALR